MDDDGGGDFGGGSGDHEAFGAADDAYGFPALRVLNRPGGKALRTVATLGMFYAWCPLILLTEERWSWNDEHWFWWRLALYGWIACCAVVTLYALPERLRNRRLERQRSR